MAYYFGYIRYEALVRSCFATGYQTSSQVVGQSGADVSLLVGQCGRNLLADSS